MSRSCHALVIAYDGAAFCGFRRQRGQPTVEGTVRAALQAFCGERIALSYAGATDRGMHAFAQVIGFRTCRRVDLARARGAIEAWVTEPSSPTPFPELDARLGGRALRVVEAAEVPRSFHASFSAVARRYRYLLPAQADACRLHALLAPLVGKRCFSAFARDTPSGRSTIKRLFEARPVPMRGGMAIELSASGFLRRQVRVMIATALREAARGSSETALLDLARRGLRAETAPPATPGRLVLWGVDYPSDSGAPSLRPRTSPSVARSSSPEEAATHRPAS